MKKPELNHDDVEILSHEVGYQGYFRIEKYQVRHRLFKGGWSVPLSRVIFERGCAAAALLYDPDLDKIVLIEQFRIGAMADQNTPWLIELVAGIIDEKDDSAESVVCRETEEEAGLKVTDMMPIANYWVSPGGTTERLSLFCARVDASQAGGIHGLDEEGEDIRVLVVDPSDAYEAVESGRIDNAMAIIGIQWLQLHYEKVRQMWQ